ncbi:MAG: winged helix-turn-helix domain-containing protein [Lachnospiraceae bacterium]|nr:winged helix-turn-helix domain-containing protein [Lachnospiraceae bacterium]
MGIKYKEVADQLRHEILDQNTYAGTKKLPTEQELMERYHVSRQTVRQALSILLAENLIQKRQGSGTYLSEQALSPAHGSGSIAILTPFAGDATFPAMLWDIHRRFYPAPVCSLRFFPPKTASTGSVRSC